MIKKVSFLSLFLCTLLVLSVASAQAFPLFYSGTTESAGTKFEDNDLDFLVEWNDNNDDGLASWDEFAQSDDSAGLNEGSLLLSVLEFDNLVNQTGGPGYDLNEDLDELVGLSVIEVDEILTDRIIFKQFMNLAMVEFYAGGTDELLDTVNDDPTVQDAIADVVDGSFLWSFSIDANDADTRWRFFPNKAFVEDGGDPTDPAEIRTLGGSTVVGSIDVILNQVDGADIFEQWATGGVGDGYADLKATGQIKGGGGNTNAFATSDFDVEVNPIPEPATLSLFGISLLGLAYISRRRR